MTTHNTPAARGANTEEGIMDMTPSGAILRAIYDLRHELDAWKEQAVKARVELGQQEEVK